MHFRRTILEDVPELTALRVAFLREAENDFETPVDTLTENIRRYLLTHIPSGAFAGWAALDKGRMVATGGICFHSYPPNFGAPVAERGYIMNMYTLPAYRGRGLAGKLFGKLLEEARQRGVSLVSLHATDMGRSLYEKFGFSAKEGEMKLRL